MADAISYEPMAPAHADGVFKLMRDEWIRDEPTFAALGMQWEECGEFYCGAFPKCVADGMSVVALNSNGEVVGFLETLASDRGQYPPNAQEQQKLPAKMRIVTKYIAEMEGDLWGKDDWIHEESTFAALDIDWHESAQFFRNVFAKCASAGISVVALNSKREVVGIRLTSAKIRDDSKHVSNAYEAYGLEVAYLMQMANPDVYNNKSLIPSLDAFRTWPRHCTLQEKKQSAKMHILLKYLEEMEGDLWSKLPPDVCKLAGFELVGTRKDYLRRGVATEMVRRSMRLAKEKQFQGAVVYATAWRSQRMFTHVLKFELLTSVEHERFVDEHGNRYLNCKDGTTCGLLMFKRIE